MKLIGALLLSLLISPAIPFAKAQVGAIGPFSAKKLERRLESERPRLIWRKGDERRIAAAASRDPAVAILRDEILTAAEAMLSVPVLERNQVGRRILATSRKALKRGSYLSMAWRMTGDRRYLERAEALLIAVSRFDDWNPSHFLDVAEMSLAVALTLDWCGDDLSPETRSLARDSLYEFGLKAGENPRLQEIFARDSNWNQVCNAGMVAAAIELADRDPEMAARALNRMLANLPKAMAAYAPDGAYEEGAMYWAYGTLFNVVLIDALKTGFGRTYKIEKAFGFMESADFVRLMEAPSGKYYNYYDGELELGFSEALSWFARQTGNPNYLQNEVLLDEDGFRLSAEGPDERLAPVSLLWLSHFNEKKEVELPLSWRGRGDNPLVVFRSSFDDPNALFLGAKGGKGTNHHANLDGGSFVFELDGVRWGIDLGNQSYHPLEEYYKSRGGSIWGTHQSSVRWDLLTKNNFGHSTLTVDSKLHVSRGRALLTRFDAKSKTASFNLKELFGAEVKRAMRSFQVLSDSAVKISDQLLFAEEGHEVRWQLMTVAEVKLVEGGAILRQDGKTLQVSIAQPSDGQFSVTKLDPPPHEMDKRIPNLKRLDLVAMPDVGGGPLAIEVVLGSEL
ncbi:heparinase II/III family protein [Pelagicoccus albus]|uniref:Heparinase II/III family protein n=1 Tax=Pelagicoccus albus TaxID=415222 RepID=A0A7X1B5U6_9BACT|nr:heparinase II/III family protein [Pelagicoccus albus]MBC2604950.1 heparinase II/III family protein [Pelagicoccus albus]